MAPYVDSRVPRPIRLALAHSYPVLLSALLCFLAVADAGAAILLRRIAVTGDHAPGTDPGVIFKEFGGLPGIGEDFAPQIDGEGNMDFHAQLEGPGINNGNMFDGNALGIWKDPVLGSMTLVARQDDHAPGTDPGVEFMGFTTPLSSAPPLIAGGHAAFVGGLRGPGIDGMFFTNAVGIWADTPGPLTLLYRLGDPVPDLPAGNTFLVFGLPLFTADGHIAVNAVWRAPGAPPDLHVPDQEGFWRDHSGALRAIVKGGDPAPMTEPGVVFGQGAQFAIGGAFRLWDANVPGGIAINGNLKGPGIHALNDEGIWVETDTGFRLLAREGALAPGAAPGVIFGAPNGIDCFSDGVALRINGERDAMFGSRLSGPTVPFMRSIWTYRGGELDLLIQGTLPLPQSVPGDPAPGLPPGYTFSNMPIADFNAASLVAFTGVVTFNMSFEDQTEGIWWENPGGAPGPLSLLVHEGGAVLDAPPGATYTGPNRFLTFGDNGQVAFLGALRDSQGNIHQALFMTDLAGQVHLVVRTGAFVEVGESLVDERMVAVIVPGRINASGEIPFELGFFGGSSGLFTARIEGTTAVDQDPEPASARAMVRLDPSYPNPMHSATAIPFDLAAPGRVELRIHDVTGRVVTELVNGVRTRGAQSVRWDGRDRTGRLVPSGVYFVELASGGGRARERIVVAR